MYSLYKYERTCSLCGVTGVRAEASQRVREAIVAATVRVVAREGVGAVTHRGVAAEAEVSLSSTTWHFATKADILAAALHWTRAARGRRASARSPTASAAPTSTPPPGPDELADWLVEQVTAERELTVALYRLQAELLGSPGALELHREWGDGLHAVGARVAEIADTDLRLIIAALDGLRITALNADELDWLRPTVLRQLSALLG